MSPPHNPANVPTDKLPPGRRFLTKAERQQRITNRIHYPEIWAWSCDQWDKRGIFNGACPDLTYCVPEDFEP